MAADERTSSGTSESEPPRLEGIRRRELDRALARLDGPVSDRKREVLADLARSIVSSIGPAAAATARVGRASGADSRGTAGGRPESNDR